MSLVKSVVLGLIADLLRNIGGLVGIRLRRGFYRILLGKCGKNLVIDIGVSLIEPGWLSFGDNVWIDKNVVIIAGLAPHAEVERRARLHCDAEPGHVAIGDNSHIGIGTIIQGHGGIKIGRNFTTSPYCSIFSQSNDYRKCREGTNRGVQVYYLQTPVCISDNVWLGIHVSVFGHIIGGDSFVQPGSVVTSDIAPNSVAGGNPVRRIGDRFGSIVRPAAP